MKRRIAAVLLFGWLLSAAAAGAGSPVAVSTTLTDYSMGTESVVLGYTMNVRNTGTVRISDVTLSYVPLTIISTEPITLRIAALDPQADVQVPFTLTTPMLLDQAGFAREVLLWAGTCTDSDGRMIEFPAPLFEGGAP